MATKAQRARARMLRYYQTPMADDLPAGQFNAFGPDLEKISQADQEVRTAYEMASFISPEHANRVSMWASMAPGAQAGTLLALAGQGLDPDSINTPEVANLLKLDSVVQSEKEAQAGPSANTPSGGYSWWDLPKFITRNVLEGAYAPFQALEGAARTTVGALTEENGPDFAKAGYAIAGLLPPLAKLGDAAYGDENFVNPWEQTNAGQSIIAMMDKGMEGGVDQGDGWFGYGEDSAVVAAQRQATFDAGRVLWKSTGQQESWTLGRGLASVVFGDGQDTGAKTMSGVVDLAANLLLDPTIIGGKAAAVFKGARAVSRLNEVSRGLEEARALTAAAEAAGAAKDAAAAARLEQLALDIPRLEAEHLDLTQELARMRRGERKAAKAMVRESATIQVRAEAARAAQAAERDTLVSGYMSVVPDYMDSAHLARDAARDAHAEAMRTLERARRRGAGAGKVDKDFQAELDGMIDNIGDPAVVDELFANSQEIASTLGKNMGGVVTDAMPLGKNTAKGGVPFTTATPGFSAAGEAVTLAPAGRARVLQVATPLSRTVRTAEARTSLAEDLAKQIGGAKNASAARKEAAEGLRVLINDPKATWGDVLNFAADFNITRPVALVLAKRGIHGISGVRAARGLPESPHGPGIWWTTLDNAGDVGEAAGQYIGRRAAQHVQPTAAEARAAYQNANREVQVATRIYMAEGRKQLAARKLVDRHERAGTDARVRYQENANVLRDSRSAQGAIDEAIWENRTYLDQVAQEAENLRALAGKYTDHTWRSSYDWTQARDFLFGTRRGKATLQHLVDETDLAQLYRLTSGKLPHEAYQMLVDAKTESDVLGILATYVGKEILGPIKGKGGAVEAAIKKMPGGITLRDKGSRLFGMAAAIVPKGVQIRFKDPEAATNDLLNYARYLGMDRKMQDDLLRNALSAQTEADMRNVVTGTFDVFNEHLADLVMKETLMTTKSRDDLLREIQHYTRVYSRGRIDQETYLAKKLGEGSDQSFMTVDGEKITLPNAEIDSELARGGVILPDPTALRRAATKGARLIQGNPASRAVRSIVAGLFGTFWRTAALVFRPAFIIRNIAEEQVRMFLNGGPSIFTHPVGIVTMAMGVNKRSRAVTRLTQDFKKWEENYSQKQMDEFINGKMMRTTDEQENAVFGVADTFTEAISHMYSPLRPSEYRQGVSATAVGIVTPHAGKAFAKGWANELMLLRNSALARMVAQDAESYPQIARLAKATGSWEDATLTYLQSTPEGIKWVDEVASSAPEMGKILRDPQAAREYLFGTDVKSVKGRMDAMAARNPAIEEFFRTGKLIDDEDNVLFDMGATLWRDKKRTGTAVEQRWDYFTQQLEPLVKSFSPDLMQTMKVRGQADVTKTIGRAQEMGALASKAVDGFFDISARLERAASFGPEYRYSYWDFVGRHAELLTPEAKAAALEVARRTVPRPKNRIAPQWQDQLFKRLESDKHGHLDVDDIQELASMHAGKHVKELFYNATNEQAFWHSMRLVFPFGQAFANSLEKWTSLALRKPVHVYQYSLLHRNLMSQGSNTLYALQNAILPGDDLDYDESQGFFWTDPNDPEQQRRFWYPKILTAPLGAFGPGDQGQLSASADSLNLLAGGAAVLPGVGPLGSMLASGTGLNQRDGAIADFLTKWSQPFGEPDYSNGFLEQMLPSWARTLLVKGGWIPGGEQQRLSTTKQAAVFLASQPDQYNGALLPEDQAKLMEDADFLSRATNTLLGIGAAILPASPRSDWFVRNDQDGSATLVATIAGNYFTEAQQVGYDQAKANLWERYGIAGMYAITSIYTPTTERITDDALDWYKANKDDAKRVGIETFGVFFPGDSSPAAVAWQESMGLRSKMSPAEWSQEVQGTLYRLQKANIEAIAQKQGLTIEERQTMIAALEQEFGGAAPRSNFAVRSRDDLLDQIRRGLGVKSIADLPQGQEAMQALALYDGATKVAKERNGDGLAAEANADIARLLMEQLDQLEEMSMHRVNAYGGNTVSGVTDVIRTLITTQEN
ncbi:MAG: hypothetical protein AB7U23_12490 [Dehalococcoidia bacterium]